MKPWIPTACRLVSRIASRFVALVALAISAQSGPKELLLYRAGFTLGLGSSFGNESGSSSSDNFNYEANFRWMVEKDTLVGVRAGGRYY